MSNTSIANADDLNADRIDAYLKQHIPGLKGNLQLTRAVGGQSNPTYFLSYESRDLVLRRRPDGVLLPSAHAVSREFRIQKALAESPVCVPRMLLHSTDLTVTGTEFYILERIEGRIFQENNLSDAPRNERMKMCFNAAEMLAKLHKVDIRQAGLYDFGRHGGYFERQIKRWGKQWHLSKNEDLDTIDHLLEWLPRYLPTQGPTTLVHGDYRTGNIIYNTNTADIAAVLDWELATLGEPLADVAHCVAYLYLMGNEQESPLVGKTIQSIGLPTVAEFVDKYESKANIKVQFGRFHLAFVLFRNAVIYQGVADRARRGNAADDNAIELGCMAPIFARRAAELTGCDDTILQQI